ncbi:MAG: type II secretion system protein GspD [Verrucomicrobiae bacterium]|nr:type II secretion system protein GspD [Verrucomicrobiae bacterium]
MKNNFIILSCIFLMIGVGCAGTRTPRNAASEAGVDVGIEALQEKSVGPVSRVDQDMLDRSAADEATRKILDDIKRRDAEFNARLNDISGQAQPGRLEGSAKAAHPSETGTQKISFDFYNTEIQDVILLFMKLLEANYNLYPGLSGKVSLHIEDEFSRDQIVALMLGLLRMYDIAALKEGSVWNFMPLGNLPQKLGPDDIMEGEYHEPARGQVIQAFRIRFIKTAELVKVVQPYLSKGAMLFQDDAQGILLVCDFPHVLAKIQRLIPLFDVSVFADVAMKTYTLKFATAADVVKELNGLVKEFGLSNGGPHSKISFLGFNRLNKLLVATRDPQLLEFADAWVTELDQEIPQLLKEEQQENIYVYYAQNSNAKDMVTTLEGLFKDRKTKEDASKKTKADEAVPMGQQIKEREQAKQEKQAQEGGQPQVQPEAGPQPAPAPIARDGVSVGEVSGELTGEVQFVVDENTNAILIRCNGADYKKVKAVMDKLDIYPRQVLIEVVIAEISLDESMALGVEWQYIFQADGAKNTVGLSSGLGVVGGTSSSISSGLSYLIESTDRLKAALKAYADKNRVNILSSPHILSSDNTEAKINIGEEVPIVTSELRTNPEGTTNTTVDKTIQYRKVGIILNVTPHINENGMVRMEISQEVSKLLDKTVKGIDSPLFSQRQLNTTLAVNDEQTVVIGGLIEQVKTLKNTGIPGLNRIPLLKYLFGYEGHSIENKELMLFITPHVIKSVEDSSFLTRDFLDRLRAMKESF